MLPGVFDHGGLSEPMLPLHSPRAPGVVLQLLPASPGRDQRQQLLLLPAFLRRPQELDQRPHRRALIPAGLRHRHLQGVGGHPGVRGDGRHAALAGVDGSPALLRRVHGVDHRAPCQSPIHRNHMPLRCQGGLHRVQRSWPDTRAGDCGGGHRHLGGRQKIFRNRHVPLHCSNGPHLSLHPADDQENQDRSRLPQGGIPSGG
mmetsp:Transcript_31921/g.44244  ORF Transcript_31921/g.44244 Transcript_31921/m.44244 type:complete len:202 (-) Transcript_31921:826-1431(-)